MASEDSSHGALTTLRTKIDEILEFLASSNRPCPIEEITARIGVPEDTCRKVVDFLTKYHFVQQEGQRLRIDPGIGILFDASRDEKYVFSCMLPMVTPSPKKKREG